MDELRRQLARCFQAVFPGLKEPMMDSASPYTVPEWDSAATVTLFSAMEEELGRQIDPTDLGEDLSFQHIYSYLKASHAVARE